MINMSCLRLYKSKLQQHLTLNLCFFLFFLMIDLYFLITDVIAQIFNPTAELVIPTGIPINKANAEIETQPQTAEIKIKTFKVI